jgi:type 1 glutamine amidotransferase
MNAMLRGRRALARWGALIIAIFVLVACETRPTPPVAPSPTRGPRILVFTHTAAFRHDSIPDAIAAVRRLGETRDIVVDATEDGSFFTDATLARYAAVVFLLTSGDVLEDEQQGAFERYIRAGGGYAGVHSASDTEYDWPWYGKLVGAYFRNHPAVQQADVVIEDAAHPASRGLPARWTYTDEWYNFRTNPSSSVRVLARLDESSYTGGAMGEDHPWSWCHVFEGGRSWYTAGGHPRDAYADPLFVEHLLGGIAWAAGAAEGDCST